MPSTLKSPLAPNFDASAIVTLPPPPSAWPAPSIFEPVVDVTVDLSSTVPLQPLTPVRSLPETAPYVHVPSMPVTVNVPPPAENPAVFFNVSV
jgi:hypothetical protein